MNMRGRKTEKSTAFRRIEATRAHVLEKAKALLLKVPSMSFTDARPENLLNFLVFLLLSTLFAGISLSILSLFATTQQSDLHLQSICFRSECINFFLETISGSVWIISFTGKALTIIATCGGIVVAILGYLNNAQSSALGNHIAHLSIFSEYVKSEIHKLDRLHISDFDILFLYNLIFTESRKGMTSVSTSYRRLIEELNSEIDASNKQASKAASGSFRYKPHQERIIKILKKIGISIEFMPRNDFFEAEGQTFSLINTINKSFCLNQDVPNLKQRIYI